MKMKILTDRECKIIYDKACDFLCKNADPQISRLDELEDKTWLKDEPEVIQEKEKLKRQISRIGDVEIKRLLANDLSKIMCFQQWLKRSQDDDDRSAGEDWWKNVPV